MFADQIVQSLNQAFYLDGTEVHVSASVGIVGSPADGATVDDLIRHVDIGMYKIKASGKHGHRFYDKTMSIR